MASQDKEAKILLAYMHRVRRHGKNASPRGGEWGGASWTLRPQEPHRQGEVFSSGRAKEGTEEVAMRWDCTLGQAGLLQEKLDCRGVADGRPSRDVTLE